MKRPFQPRSARKRVRRRLAATIERLAENLEARLGRPVSDEKIARALAKNVTHVKRALSAVSGGAP